MIHSTAAPQAAHEGSQDCHLLLPPTAQLFVSPPLTHDKRAIASETDTLGCFLATYQQQSLSSSFRSLSSLMKDRRWNSMVVIATVTPSPPPARPPLLLLNLIVTTQLSLFSAVSGFSGLYNADPKMHKQSHIFRSFFAQPQWDLCVGCNRCISHICKYLWVCFIYTRSFRWMYKGSEDKNEPSFHGRLCLSLGQVF